MDLLGKKNQITSFKFYLLALWSLTVQLKFGGTWYSNGVIVRGAVEVVYVKR